MYNKIIKKIMLTFVFIVLFFGFSYAIELGFSPDRGNFAGGCLVSVDMVYNDNFDEIFGTDILIDANMEFVDFVPNDLWFESVLPPIILDNGMIKLGMFSIKNGIKDEIGEIGKLYFNVPSDITEASISYYFKGMLDYIDTSVYIKDSKDVLANVQYGYYLVNDTGTCLKNFNITGGFLNKSYEESIFAVQKELIQDNYGQIIKRIILKNKYYILILIGIILFSVLFRKIIFKK